MYKIVIIPKHSVATANLGLVIVGFIRTPLTDLPANNFRELDRALHWYGEGAHALLGIIEQSKKVEIVSRPDTVSSNTFSKTFKGGLGKNSCYLLTNTTTRYITMENQGFIIYCMCCRCPREGRKQSMCWYNSYNT